MSGRTWAVAAVLLLIVPPSTCIQFPGVRQACAAYCHRLRYPSSCTAVCENVMREVVSEHLQAEEHSMLQAPAAGAEGKRQSNFIRIGRSLQQQQRSPFLRMGRAVPQSVSVLVGSDDAAEKRALGNKFVRLGKAGKRGPFVRIGKGSAGTGAKK